MNDERVGGAAVGVFYGLGIFEDKSRLLTVERVENPCGVVVIPPLIAEVVGDMNNRNGSDTVGLGFTHQAFVGQSNRQIFHQAGQSAGVPVVGNYQIRCGIFFKQCFDEFVHCFGKESKTFNLVYAVFVHDVAAVLCRRIIPVRVYGKEVIAA